MKDWYSAGAALTSPVRSRLSGMNRMPRPCSRGRQDGHVAGPAAGLQSRISRARGTVSELTPDGSGSWHYAAGPTGSLLRVTCSNGSHKSASPKGCPVPRLSVHDLRA
jgi:hypothetical protein